MKRTFFLTAIVCLCLASSAQNSEEEKIQKVIQAETKSFYDGNLEAWRATWAHDPNVMRTLIANNYHYFKKGWDGTNADTETSMKNYSKPNSKKIENTNYNIVQQGNMAWVYYDQTVKSADDTPNELNVSKEYRVLVKQNDTWKIIAQITTAPQTFDLSKPFALENNINHTGYALLDAKKFDEAIDMFKTNVKLFPNSWNAYDSLADAHEKMGNKKLAIENYEKSVQMNPKNEHGTQALAKLRMN